MRVVNSLQARDGAIVPCIPLQDAPQTAQVRMAFSLPALPSSRLPQSVQNTREPMADMLGMLLDGNVQERKISDD